MEKEQNIKYIKVRQYLHEHAELSGKERKTANYIRELLLETKPVKIISNVGGHGVVAVYDSGTAGKNVMIRADIDALPIEETGELAYRSRNRGVSHKCGHDGHIVILLSLAIWLSEHIKELKGKVFLLFQPAEETAQGARAILADKKFISLKPDYIFGLHNLPGFPLNSLIIREGVFAMASAGLKFRFTGKTSHAAHPENGISPLPAMLKLIAGLNKLPLTTIIHLRLGDEAFGTSPGEGEVMVTFRAVSDEMLQKQVEKSENLAQKLAVKYGLLLEMERVEEFAATVNDAEAFGILERAALESKLPIIRPPEPFRWTEDFSFYSQKYKTVFFGLGSGENCPQLHNPDYDFPDELIENGREIFAKIVEEVMKA
ncbi:MAG: amidohydrolase [Candidatus Cloacimonetes bacterium]|nr:amidohydrolase [Candidatus Cloacimonadota bacterium]